MKTGKALELGKFLNEALDVFIDVFENDNTRRPDMDAMKTNLNDSAFKSRYQAFLVELRDNIIKFRDIKVVNDYVYACLIKCKRTNLFEAEYNRYIIARNVEVTFLLNLKKNIELYTSTLCDLMGPDQAGPTDKLKELYDQTFSSLPVGENTPPVEEDKPHPGKKKQPDRPFWDERFDFATVKANCNLLPDLLDRLDYIFNVTVDFKQWQIQFDHEVTNFATGPYYLYTEKYYPHFLELCRIEMERYLEILHRRKDFQPEPASSPAVPEKEAPGDTSSVYVWKGNDTEYLELMAALHKEKIIQRRDRKDMTRGELIALFLPMLGLKINNIEEKLTKATNRNDKTPLLDRLKTGFENFAEEKEEKLRKRR